MTSSPPRWHGIVAPVLRLLIRLLAKSYRFELCGEQRLDRAIEGDHPSIYVFWHHQLLLAAPLIFDRLLPGKHPLTVMISQSRDGELTTRVAERWGFRVCRGSASRGGRVALRGLYRELAKHDSSILMLPDGPHGPTGVVKPGVVVLAQTAGCPIVPVGLATQRPLRLRSWDRLQLPLPRARISAQIGEPISVPRDFKDEERERARQELEATLERLSEQAASDIDREPESSSTPSIGMPYGRP